MKSRLSAWPYFDESQINAVSEVLKTGKVNYWTGENTKKFEKEFAKFVQTKYATAVSNGTVALELAYRACGIGKGDEIITTSRTFLATSTAAMTLGAIPIFIDVDTESGNINPKEIEKYITKKTKAISIVHFAGWPADVIEISLIAKKNGLFLIEDCSQAHGAKVLYKNEFKSVGSFGDVSTWSFCQDKIITTGGEGGMVTTSSKKIWQKVWSYKDHGKNYEIVFNNEHNPGFRWLHDAIGSNYRITEMQSSIGIIQLKNLNEWIEIRNRNANILIECLSDCEIIRIPKVSRNIIHAYYKFYCYLKLEMLNIDWNRELSIVEGPLDLLKTNDNATCLLGSALNEDFKLFQKIVDNKTDIGNDKTKKLGRL